MVVVQMHQEAADLVEVAEAAVVLQARAVMVIKISQEAPVALDKLVVS
jgi:hypothetical protein